MRPSPLGLFLISRILQLIAHIHESIIQLLQVRNTNIHTPLCARLILNLLLRQSQLRLHHLNTQLVSTVAIMQSLPWTCWCKP